MVTALLRNNSTQKVNGHSDQGVQKIMSSIENEWKHTWVKKFFYFTAAIITIPLKFKMDSLAIENKNKPINQIKKLTFYGIDVVKTTSSLIAGVFFLFLLERIVAQY